MFLRGDYVLDFETAEGASPLLSVFGGKITTARRLAEQSVDRLARLLGDRRDAWTAASAFPGGSFTNLAALVAASRSRWPELPAAMIERMARAYGTDLERVLHDARTMGDLGRDFGEGLTEAEVRYLVRHEWAQTADDILWRRSKLGITFSRGATCALAEFLASIAT